MNSSISRFGNIIVKNVSYSEIEAMEIVKKNTNIKIPEIYKIVECRGQYFIFMEYIDGEPICDLLEKFDEKQKENIKNQLKNILEQLRKIPNPYKYYVCSADGGPVKDYRISSDNVGPFINEEEFNKKIGNTKYNKKYKSVFTHADIKPQNIIINKNGDILIIDWECAGWYPEYWEYTKSLFNINTYTEWIDMMTQIFKEYKDELNIEKNILKTHSYY